MMISCTDAVDWYFQWWLLWVYTIVGEEARREHLWGVRAWNLTYEAPTSPSCRHSQARRINFIRRVVLLCYHNLLQTVLQAGKFHLIRLICWTERSQAFINEGYLVLGEQIVRWWQRVITKHVRREQIVIAACFILDIAHLIDQMIVIFPISRQSIPLHTLILPKRVPFVLQTELRSHL